MRLTQGEVKIPWFSICLLLPQDCKSNFISRYCHFPSHLLPCCISQQAPQRVFTVSFDVHTVTFITGIHSCHGSKEDCPSTEPQFPDCTAAPNLWDTQGKSFNAHLIKKVHVNAADWFCHTKSLPHSPLVHLSGGTGQINLTLWYVQVLLSSQGLLTSK